ncbi:hypothetical protein M9H77_26900 [Catharanthus roseus]|uniref:Uncharacterized protein n=1 Tax=Catharanthus roseus TaxID=4058 RepID=A0ACC0AB09_CATRO|nr:hypothetical protein M9H77_26900 [Catharanthus roseus]
MELKLGPITGAQRRKLKILEDNGIVAYMEEALKSKLEGFEARIIQGNQLEEKMAKGLKRSTLLPKVTLPLPLPVVFCRSSIWKTMPYHQRFIMLTDGHLPTQSHEEGTSDPIRMNLNETLQSMQQSIEGLAIQFQGVARDVEELKKGKGSVIIEQRVGDNHEGVHSPPHQRPYDNVPPYGYYDMLVQNSYPFHESHKKRFQDMKHGMKITLL